jgi:hypothetical protein
MEPWHTHILAHRHDAVGAELEAGILSLQLASAGIESLAASDDSVRFVPDNVFNIRLLDRRDALRCIVLVENAKDVGR